MALLGECALEMGLAREALYYWAQAVHATESGVNAPGFDGYHELALVADVLGRPEGVWFRRRAYALTGTPVDPADSTTLLIRKEFPGRRHRRMPAVLIGLVQRYGPEITD